MSISIRPTYMSTALGSVASTPAAMTVVEANAALLAKRLTQAVVIEDTQANMQANLGALQKIATAGKLSSVSFSEGDAALQFNTQQLSGSAALLTKLSDAGVSITVQDRAANLSKMASKLSVDYNVTVEDTAANVQANLTGLSGLAAAGKLDTVHFTDSGTPTVTFKASQYATMGTLRDKLADASLVVNDTAANVARYAVSDASAIVVKDASSSILKNFNALRDLAANAPNLSFVVTNKGASMELTAAQYVGSEALRAKLPSVNFTIKDTATNVRDNINDLLSLRVSVTDTAAHVQDSLDALGQLAQAGKLQTLKITDAANATLNMTAVQATQLGNVSGVGVVIQDTAENIQSNFDALLLVRKVKGIQLEDTARPSLQVTEAQYKKGTALLAKISGAAVTVQFSKNFNDYSIKANANGSYAVGNSQYKGVNFFAFKDFTTFADTGDANLNAMLLGATNYWWRDTTSTVTASDSLIKTGVYALGAGSAKQTLTYSFLTNAGGSASDQTGFKVMTVSQQEAVRGAFDYLSSLIGVSFIESDQAGQADINLGTNNQTSKASSGYANVPNGSGSHPVYLFLDNSLGSVNSDLSQGTYGWETLIHEIGHTLGLKHPGNYNAGGGGSPGPYLPTALDTRQYSLMSYNNPAGTAVSTATNLGNGTTRYKTTFLNQSTYMMYDIAALQFLYGKGSGAGLGTYQTNSFTADWSGLETLWMPSNGTINASGVSNANIIDLREGAFSSINIVPKTITDSLPPALRTSATYMGLNNVGLAYGSDVTTALGGTGDDVFYTATDADVSINGGGGTDTVYLAGAAADWVNDQNGSYTNAKLARTVKLTNVANVKYYNADTYSTTHSRVDLLA